MKTGKHLGKKTLVLMSLAAAMLAAVYTMPQGGWRTAGEAGRLELAIAMKDNKKALEYMELLVSNTDTMLDYMKSDLYEHVKFREVDPAFLETMRANTLKRFAEHDMYKAVRKSAGWKEFKKKYYGNKDNSCS